MFPLELDGASWSRLNRLLDDAFDQPPAVRAAWIESLGSELEPLKGHLRDLFSRATAIETGEFLESLPGITLEIAPSPAQARADDLIGPYRLSRELGGGGMGVVWLAERSDGILARPVALKLPNTFSRHPNLAARMAREREILATLEHPNIARLYDAGVDARGQPYLALEYVEGEAVDAYCESRQLDLESRLRLFLEITDAVAYAHGKLIVHRDLKPANVLVNRSGNVRLLDFGIAKLLEEGGTRESHLTQAAGLAFTPEYASPEQIRGEPLGTASDVYSLGVLLFRLVTGERPYRLGQDSRVAMENAVLQAEPVRPSERAPDLLRRDIGGDLDTIILKCLKKNPEERYATVNALAEDIERYLANRPILARADGRWYRAAKFVARNRVAVAAAAAVLVAIIAGAGIAAWQARMAFAERDRAAEVKRFIASILQGTNPYQRAGGNLSALDLLHRARRQIATEFVDRPDLRIELLNIVGTSLDGLGDDAAAEEVLSANAADAARYRGAGSVESVRARTLLAGVHDHRRNTNRLEVELQELLPLARAVAREDPEPLVRVLMYSADLDVEVRHIEDARVVAREAFETARRSLGDGHRLTVQASNLLAETFSFAPIDVPTWRAEAERGMSFARAAFPPGAHDPLLTYMQTLYARSLYSGGHLREAARGYAESVKTLRADLGNENADVANALSELAGTERNIGEIRAALQHDRESVEIQLHLGNTSSADFMDTLLGYGASLLAARRPAEALAQYQRARQIAAQLTGPLSWDTLGATFRCAWALAYLGRHAEARELMALADQPGVKIAYPLWFERVKGTVERLGGENAAAIASLRRALTLITEGPRAKWDRMNIDAEMGLAELQAGDLDAASLHLDRMRETAEQNDVSLFPLYADVLSGLGQIELRRGHRSAALLLFDRVEKFWRDFDTDNPEAEIAHAWVERARQATG